MILKGILLYITIFLTALFVCAVDSLLDKGVLLISITILAILIYSCYKLIGKKELHQILNIDDKEEDDW